MSSEIVAKHQPVITFDLLVMKKDAMNIQWGISNHANSSYSVADVHPDEDSNFASSPNTGNLEVFRLISSLEWLCLPWWPMQQQLSTTDRNDAQR